MNNPGKNGRFRKEGHWVSVNDSVIRIMASFEKMGVGSNDIVVSTNIRTRLDGLPRSNEPDPSDRGAAVYWKESRGGATKCMAIDMYTTVADNLAAIAATLEAMRAIERHGGAEILNRAFTGFAALPAKASQPWREVLGLEGKVSSSEVMARFRALAAENHPDIGGDREKLEAIVEARKQALAELGG